MPNNADRELTLDVDLDDPSQGTLYGPNGPGNTVTLTLGATETGSVDIESGVADGTTIPFSIRHDGPDLVFDIDRETTVQSGNSSGEVSIDKLTQFKADQSADEWTINTLEASSTNYDLDTVELSVEEQATGDVVATRTYSNITGTSFTRTGTGNDPGITLPPDDGSYDVQEKQQVTYELTVVATDTDGNFAQETDTT